MSAKSIAWMLLSWTLFLSLLQAAPSRKSAPENGFPKQLWHKVFVIAHQGNSSEAPGDTLVSFKQAFDLGADMIELDVHLSRDGVPVVIHNDTVDSRTNGKGNVSDLSLAELKKLDAGSWKNPKYANERIPTLKEVLQLSKDRGQVFLDLKVEGLGQKVAGLVRTVGFERRNVVVGTWTPTQTRDFSRYLRGAQILRTSNDVQNLPPGFFDKERARGITGFELGNNWTPEFIQAAHAHKMPVYAYTVNDLAWAHTLIGMGIDGIETDVPGPMLKMIKEMSVQ